MERLADRADAGRQLVKSMPSDVGSESVVLALPRGGVPVAVPLARALEAPLSVLVIRKLGVPGHEEYGFGAIGEGNVRVIDDDVVKALGIRDDQVSLVAARELAELDRRVFAYRGRQPLPSVVNRTVLLVDDGIATGGSMRAAVEVVRAMGASRIVVAAGAASKEAVALLRDVADQVIAVLVPHAFSSVGQWFDDFQQVTDADVTALLTAFEQP